MRFRTRVILLIALSLAVAQALTAALLYGTARSNLIEQGKSQLARSTEIFLRQMDILSDQAADAVEVLALDFPLREAIAEGQRETTMSVLRNHGSRVGASRMFVISLDGTIAVDTANPKATGMRFPVAGILDMAEETRATTFVVLDGVICSLVVAPVRAPLPISFIAACLPIDGERLSVLGNLSAVPAAIMLTSRGEQGTLTVMANGAHSPPAAPRPVGTTPGEAAVIEIGGSEYLSVTTPLDTPPGARPIYVTLDYPLEESLSQYRAFVVPILLVLALTLVASVAGAVLIARSVSRPVEVLADAARRIGRGEAVTMSELPRRSEIGQLSAALTGMAEAVRAREADLRLAVDKLEAARDAAVAADRAKSKFLANMSHELRTPLNAVIGFSEIMNQQILGPLGSGQYVEYARMIHDSGDRLLALVEEMLELAKIEEHTLMMEREPVDLGPLVMAVAKSLEARAAAVNVTVSAADDLAQMGLVVDGDGKRLRQIFAHILDNAVKFSPDGGTVTITAEVVEGRARISVGDEGIGVSEQDIPRLTEPFFRVDSAYDGQHQGAGLGLSLAKSIAELHGGSLEISSRGKRGTLVAVSLPLSATEQRREAEPKEHQRA